MLYPGNWIDEIDRRSVSTIYTVSRELRFKVYHERIFFLLGINARSLLWKNMALISIVRCTFSSPTRYHYKFSQLPRQISWNAVIVSSKLKTSFWKYTSISENLSLPWQNESSQSKVLYIHLHLNLHMTLDKAEMPLIYNFVRLLLNRRGCGYCCNKTWPWINILMPQAQYLLAKNCYYVVSWQQII